MKVRVKVDDLIYITQCLTAIKVALDAGQIDLAKAYVSDLTEDVNDALKAL